jgi:hypothetical protein
MIDERGSAVAINHAAISQSEQISVVAILIAAIAFFFAQPRPGVFDDVRAILDRRSGVAAGSVDWRGANDQGHESSSQLTVHSLQSANLLLGC